MFLVMIYGRSKLNLGLSVCIFLMISGFCCCQECLQVEKGKNFYDFQFNTRLVKSTIAHFQVENLTNYICYVWNTLFTDAWSHLGFSLFIIYKSSVLLSSCV